jgi:molybdenum cofactor cytidylyltransferase
MVSAILLAAGESRRMGSLKQLLPLSGKSFVRCCVDNLLASKAAEVIVVTGYEESLVREELSGTPVTLAHNRDYQLGMGSSVRRGIEAVSGNSDAALIALVDQPQIGPDIIDTLIDAYETKRPLIAIPTYRGQNGHPVILDMSLRDEVAKMDLKSGLRQVVRAHADSVMSVAVDRVSVLIDCDYPEDYRRIRDDAGSPGATVSPQVSDRPAGK